MAHQSLWPRELQMALIELLVVPPSCVLLFWFDEAVVQTCARAVVCLDEMDAQIER